MRTLIAFALCSLPVAGAQALDVEFNGLVVATCSLALSTPGTLDLAADGQSLSSQEGLAVPAVVAILSLGPNTVQVAAPTRVSAAPSGYDTASEVVEVSYSGISGLSFVSQGYVSSATSFAVGTIPLSLLTINNRITNPAGFAPGSYTTRTVVTCS